MGFGEGFHGPAPAVAPQAGSFHAAEGGMGFVVHRAVVDVRHAGFQAVRQFQAMLFVRGDDGGGQAVVALVGQRHGFVFRIEGGDGRHRAEGFLPKQLHLRRHAADHRGLVVQTLVAAARMDGGALGAGVLHLPADLLQLLLVDDRADDVPHRVPHAQGGGFRRYLFREFLRP